jgi:primosomal protein N' (replication factor Y) (superfamily II helicase)
VISRLPNDLSTDLSTAIVDNAAAGAPTVLRVAIDMPRVALFDYLPPAGSSAAQVPLGARVRVPMGSGERIGVVVGYASQAAVGAGRLKAVADLIDQTPLFDEVLLRLLHWTAQYYHHPLGEVIAAAMPKALRDGRPALALRECWRVRDPDPAALGRALESLGGGE